MSTKTKLILDLSMFGAFLAVANPHLTGNTIHEWLGVSMAGAIITHLLFNWKWIVDVTKNFFKKLWHKSRLNFVVNTLFFIAMTGTLFSGLLISKDVMSTLGIQLNISQRWMEIPARAHVRRIGHDPGCPYCPALEMDREQHQPLHRKSHQQIVPATHSVSADGSTNRTRGRSQLRARGAGSFKDQACPYTTRNKRNIS